MLHGVVVAMVVVTVVVAMVVVTVVVVLAGQPPRRAVQRYRLNRGSRGLKAPAAAAIAARCL